MISALIALWVDGQALRESDVALGIVPMFHGTTHERDKDMDTVTDTQTGTHSIPIR